MKRDGTQLLSRARLSYPALDSQPMEAAVVADPSAPMEVAVTGAPGIARAPDEISEAAARALARRWQLDGDVLTVPEAAKLLRVGRNGLYEAIARGEVPHRRIGRKILLSQTAIVRWLEGWSLQVAEEG